jgi:hypothetical protein
MTTATAVSGSQIIFRSRRRLAIWAAALTLGGAAVGTATTLAVTHDNGSVSTAVPAAVVPGAVGALDSRGLPATADAAEQWTGGTRAATPGSRADSPEAYHDKVGPGPH